MNLRQLAEARTPLKKTLVRKSNFIRYCLFPKALMNALQLSIYSAAAKK